MKFQFDLLPMEYKSLPRDNVGIMLAIVALVLCVSAITSLNFKNKKEMAARQSEIDAAQAQLSQTYQQAAAIQPPVDRIENLKRSIQFINSNMETPGTSCVDFLTALEANVPEKVFIRDVNPKDFSGRGTVFTIDGEAATIYDVLDLISRLQKSETFRDVFLKNNSTRAVEGGIVTAFSLTCVYAGSK
ncbi:MAG TPA: PilN domain-containing protein [Candidatus Ozemobacteraceae bacterium]|nr:PilN domain-containing protein [Candidatus Ozemobacteraceae bacterium]